MKRLGWVLLLLALPGCMGFDDYVYEEQGTAMAVPTCCACSSSPASATPGIVPTVSHAPVMQTREPPR